MRTFAQKPKETQQVKAAESMKAGRAFSGQNRDVHSILHLQRIIGNQAVQRLLQSKTQELEASSAIRAPTGFAHHFSQTTLRTNAHSNIQSKLKLSTPGDKYEQEADRIADQVLRNEIADEAEDQKVAIQEKALRQVAHGKPELNEDLENRLRRSEGGGSRLSHTTRIFFEQRMLHDFSGVRIHTDNEAARMNRQLGAQAFTHGRDIYFGAGQYDFHSSQGKRLIAHELVHILQQGIGNSGSRNRGIGRDKLCIKSVSTDVFC